MKSVAIIGAGVSGLSSAHFLKERYRVQVFEKEQTPGGLIRCRKVNGSLFHICGGHVFNSKRRDVLDWFWDKFSQQNDFTKADRNSVVYFDQGKIIPYPVENHVYLLNDEIQRAFIKDLLAIHLQDSGTPCNFEEFLLQRFGKTLYQMYFRPYNEKIWKRDLNQVPLLWLEGKLPMPSIEEIIYNNFNHIKEKSFVHSSFWYEKEGGSQFLADRLSEGLDIRYESNIQTIVKQDAQWVVNGVLFDYVVFCGNIKDLPVMLKGVDLKGYDKAICELEYHGTTSVFCEIDSNPYSWIYLPSSEYDAHRIICTGNFQTANNSRSVGKGRITGTIEFTDEVSENQVKENLKHIPLHPILMDYQFNRYTYPIQDNHTRDMIRSLKEELRPLGFFITGRFADWEYYNMDVAVGAAMDLCKTI